MLKFPNKTEGELSRLKNWLVSARMLAEWGREIELGASLQLGHGEDRSGGRDKTSVLADSVEAVLGAIFTEAGFEAASKVIEGRLDRMDLDSRSDLPLFESKNQLQEVVQGRGSELPEYRLLAETGPAHARTFEVEVVIDGASVGKGTASSKKEAEQIAAKHALEFFEAML